MEWVGDKMIKEMVKGEKEKMLERNLYIHNSHHNQKLRHNRGLKNSGKILKKHKVTSEWIFELFASYLLK